MRRTIVLLLSVLLVASACGWFGGNKPNQVNSSGGKVTADSGRASLQVVKQGARDNTTVSITKLPRSIPAPDADSAVPQLHLGSTAYDIHATSGQLGKNNKVSLSIKGVVPANVPRSNISVALFEPMFDAWIPLPDSRVDGRRTMVTATAPHFSKFTVMWAVAKSTWSVLGGALGDVVKSIAQDLNVKHPDLKCINSGTRAIGSNSIPQSELDGCVDIRQDGTILRFRNKYAMPLAMTLPNGVDLNGAETFEDIDLASSMATMFLMIAKREIVIPANSTISLRVAGSVQHMDFPQISIDWSVVGVQLAWTAIGALSDLKAEEPAIKEAISEQLEAFLKGTIKSDAVRQGVTDKLHASLDTLAAIDPGFQAIGDYLSSADCVWTGVKKVESALAGNPFKDYKDKLAKVVDVVVTCGEQQIKHTGYRTLKQFESYLDVLKAVPEIFQATLSGSIQLLARVNVSDMTAEMGRSPQDFLNQVAQTCQGRQPPTEPDTSKYGRDEYGLIKTVMDYVVENLQLIEALEQPVDPLGAEMKGIYADEEAQNAVIEQKLNAGDLGGAIALIVSPQATALAKHWTDVTGCQ